jgi:hypothetical protein
MSRLLHSEFPSRLLISGVEQTRVVAYDTHHRKELSLVAVYAGIAFPCYK